jgi:hypothetical protein
MLRKIEAWFYTIPVVNALRRWHSSLPPRPWGYLVNWLGHYGVCWVLVGVGALVGLLIWWVTPVGSVAVWWGAFVGATIGLVFYTVREAPGFLKILKGKPTTAPWWDHVGDWVGPLVCWIQVLLLR